MLSSRNKVRISNILLLIFLLPIFSKVADSLFHHHHNDEIYINKNTPLNFTNYHEKCLVFQYELSIFDPQNSIPQVTFSLVILTSIAVRINNRIEVWNYGLNHSRAPPKI